MIPNQSTHFKIEEGASFGYTNQILTNSKEIQLCAGTHYLLGRNGKGKTTLLKTLAGLLPPLSGKINKQANFAYIPEDLHFDDQLSSKVILKSLLTKEAYALAEEVAEEIELDLKKTYGTLSTGNKRKVLFLLSEFQLHGKENAIILMDEPLLGLDQEVRNYIHNRWKENADQKIRLISYHPDDDDLELKSVLLISDGTLQHFENENLRWNELKATAA